MRAVSTQVGYLTGSLVGGAALALAGFAGLGVAFGLLFVASTLPYLVASVERRRDAMSLPASAAAGTRMPSRFVTLPNGKGLLVRPLRNGDVDTVAALFELLGEQSRRARFNGPKPALGSAELAHLAAVDETRHVLVAYLEGDPGPVAIARLVRDGDSAEIAFEVADEHQRRGIGSALTAELLADARAAGVREVTALVASDNTAAVSLLRRVLDRLEIRFEGPEPRSVPHWRRARPHIGRAAPDADRGRPPDPVGLAARPIVGLSGAGSAARSARRPARPRRRS